MLTPKEFILQATSWAKFASRCKDEGIKVSDPCEGPYQFADAKWQVMLYEFDQLYDMAVAMDLKLHTRALENAKHHKTIRYFIYDDVMFYCYT